MRYRPNPAELQSDHHEIDVSVNTEGVAFSGVATQKMKYTMYDTDMSDKVSVVKPIERE